MGSEMCIRDRCTVEWLATGNTNESRVYEEKASYPASQVMSATDLEKQLKKLPKDQQKSIALNIMQGLMEGK